MNNNIVSTVSLRRATPEERRRFARKNKICKAFMCLCAIFIVGVFMGVVGVTIYFVRLIADRPDDYCAPELCPKGVKHTACNPNSVPCKTFKEIALLQKEQTKILKLHNDCRKLVGVTKSLKWNEELAFLALVHARSCPMEEDKCRNTAQFLNAGQNLHILFEPDPTIRCHEAAIKSWCTSGSRMSRNRNNEDNVSIFKCWSELAHIVRAGSDYKMSRGCNKELVHIGQPDVKES
ncbi:venom allergen 5-like [Ctenocephalides felis]|uniref:venom allergen 5-like n=1 Tax=Ctenocephalides felis TaxID=7515 RepID=UPI000E6E19FB|nr:venom allergen 5-like [Ctenocephalides felis]